MLAGVFSVVFLLALWGLAALVRAAASLEYLAFIEGRTRLRAGFVFAGSAPFSVEPRLT